MSRPAPSTPRRDAGTDAGDFTSWLAALDDDVLVEVLAARPDVALPAPATIDVLSSRLRLPASTARALDGLDLPTLLVLATATSLGADTGAVTPHDIAHRLAVPTTDPDLVRSLTRLRTMALVWGDDPGVRVTAATAGAVASAPVIVPTPGEPTGETLRAALEELDGRARSMLEAIAAGPVPSGSLSSDAPTPARDAVAQLVGAGVATRGEGGAVLPTARALHYIRYGDGVVDSLLAAPEWPGRTATQRSTDEAAGVSALDLLHECELLLDSLSTAPAAALKAGGLGVRELRRIAKLTSSDEAELPLLLELLAALGLIASGDTEIGDVGYEDVWAPTEAADVWRTRSRAQRWADLVLAWWRLPVRPWLVGTEATGGGTVAAIGDQPRGHHPIAERRRLLRALAAVPDDLVPTPESAPEIVRRAYPWWIARGGTGAARQNLAEARRLGLVVTSAATSAARQLVAELEVTDPGNSAADTEGTDRGAARTDRGAAGAGPGDLVAALDASLPAQVSEVIAQADLTILAPGPLEPELAAEFALLADIESAGAATTYRVTEQSVRRALDAGRTAAVLTDLLTRTSATPLPQSLTYLIDDVARRHGQLRVGSALAFCRCEDPALLAEVSSSEAAERCAMRVIAPTVLIAQAPPLDVVDALRASGFAPVVEDTGGAVITLTRRVARVRPSPQRTSRLPGERVADAAELRQAVATMRSADKIRASRSTGSDAVRTGEAAVAFLHDAARDGTAVAVSVVDASGRSDTRLVVPVSVGAGRVEGLEPETAREVRLALHRVISVAAVDSGR